MVARSVPITSMPPSSRNRGSSVSIAACSSVGAIWSDATVVRFSA